MPKGKAKVKFVGGVWDGESFEEYDTRMMHDSVQVFSGIWAKKLPDGNIGLMKSKRFGSDWLFFQNHQYKRNGKDDNGYFVYEFENEIDNHRCEAVTAHGQQCQNIALDFDGDTAFCTSHSNK